MTDFVLTLRWTCEACGWSVDINAPGFAGDGRLHYPDGKTPCGPIRAQRADAPVVVRDATPPQRASSPTRVLIDGVPIEETPDEPGPLLRQREAAPWSRSG
jgi:hypothetical protein